MKGKTEPVDIDLLREQANDPESPFVFGANLQLGQWHLLGQDVEQNNNMAWVYLIRAANDASKCKAEACYYLMLLFKKGYKDGINKPLEQAHHYCKKGAELGQKECMLELGQRYLNIKEFTEAEEWFKKIVADESRRDLHAAAYYYLAKCHVQNENEYIEYLAKGALLKNDKAAYELGTFYLNQSTQQLEPALKYLRLSERQGNIKAAEALQKISKDNPNYKDATPMDLADIISNIHNKIRKIEYSSRIMKFDNGLKSKLLEGMRTYLEEGQGKEYTNEQYRVLLSLSKAICTLKRNKLGIFSPHSEGEFNNWLNKKYPGMELYDISLEDLKIVSAGDDISRSISSYIDNFQPQQTLKK